MKVYKLAIPILISLVVLLLIINRVNKIECFLENETCPNSLVDATNILKGSSFFFSNFESQLLKKQTEENIFILESIQKKFPNILVLNFKQEKILYSLLINEENKFIGKSGIPIPNQFDNIKTKIVWKNEQIIIENYKVNQKYHELFLNIAKNLEKSQLEKITFNWLSNQEITLELSGKPKLIFDKETIETQVKKIDTIINARELDEIEAPIKEIDMRFDLPVLRTRQ